MAAFYGILGDRIVSRVRGEDSDGRSGWQRIDSSLVCIRVRRLIIRKGAERGVEVIVDLGDILLEMFSDGWKLLARSTDHRKIRDFASPAKIKERQTNNSYLLV